MTKFYEEIIGPNEARRILSRNYNGNRKVSKQWVNQLAHMMKSGLFVAQNGDVIRIGRDGTLYDGQHRLHAVIQSGTTHIFDFAEVDDAENAFFTMDNGAKRSASDYINGVNTKAKASIARATLCIECGNASLASVLSGYLDSKTSTMPSRIEIAQFANDNEEKIGYIVSAAKRLRQNIGCGAEKAYGIAIELLLFCDDYDALDAFINDCCATMPSTPAAMLFASFMRKAYLSPRKPTNKVIVGAMLQAYNAFKTDMPIKQLSKGEVWFMRYDKLMQAKRAELRGEVLDIDSISIQDSQEAQ